MRLILLRAVAFALAVPVSVPAQASPAIAVQPSAAALDLARLMSPRDLLVAAEVREFDKHFVSSLLTKPEMKTLEDAYPGLVEAMHRSARPLVAETMGKRVDEIHGKIAALIFREFSSVEIADLTQFYRSPTGLKVIGGMAAAIDTAPIYQKAVDAPEFKVTAEDMSRQAAASAGKATKDLSASELIEMIQITTRPGFVKLKSIQPQFRTILIETINAKDPAYERKVDDTLRTAMEQHIKAHAAPVRGK